MKKEVRIVGCCNTAFKPQPSGMDPLGKQKGWQKMTLEQVKELLTIYYDIPGMIEDELAAIRHCEEEKNKITLAGSALLEMPGGKGRHSDRTASLAAMDYTRYYEDEIQNCYYRITELQSQKSWMCLALCRLNKTDRTILELALMGNPKERCQVFRRPPWKEIAGQVNYSESHTRERMRLALAQLLRLSEQNTVASILH